MTNALAIYDQFDQLVRAATALQKSGYFTDVKSEAQAIVKVMAGAELGIPPFASMTGIHIIQGKPVLGATVLATMVKNDPRYDYHIKTATDKMCVLEWYENGKGVGESSFTIEEAQAAGLTNKDNWRHYPSDMLFARAISRGARRFAPGMFGGSAVYTPDEIDVADVAQEEDFRANVEQEIEEAEVINVELPENLQPAPAQNGKKVYTKADIYQAVVEAGLSENTFSAMNALTNHCRTGFATPEQAIEWMTIYRDAKNKDGKTTVEAGKYANEQVLARRVS